MIYSGNTLNIYLHNDTIAEISFNNADHSVNLLGHATLTELHKALQKLKAEEQLSGLILSSMKRDFILGADIGEFLPLFCRNDEQLSQWLNQCHAIFNLLEDFPHPTISLINGYALGGGCELALATDFRIATQSSHIGLPEITLGIMPGFGGTIRLPRIIGTDKALELICSGTKTCADDARQIGLIDAITAPEQLKSVAIEMLNSAATGKLPWQKRREQKSRPGHLGELDQELSFPVLHQEKEICVSAHYPAKTVIKRSIKKSISLYRDEAQQTELHHFLQLAHTGCAQSLISLFLRQQQLKARYRSLPPNELNQCAVIGAGIMGGSIAALIAHHKMDVTLTDISPSSLEKGINTALTQLSVSSHTPSALHHQLLHLHPTLNNRSISTAQLVIEAVSEELPLKEWVLKEAEQLVSHETIIASNTSTLPIAILAKNLTHKARFCGIHFFNPVNKMQLVEIIRGQDTAQETIIQACSWVIALGKLPVVVKDCPGFFVNRVLFPYLLGFCQLIDEGIDFQHIDKLLTETFGWPMGPAALLDLIGLDTMHHALQLMGEAYPERMKSDEPTIVELLYKADRLGQKNGHGFYHYQNGSRKKEADPLIVRQLLHKTRDNKAISDQTIINRMMIPMLNEIMRCLEEQIISSPVEADLALVHGLGFPSFRGGALHYLDSIGLPHYLDSINALQSRSPLYQPPSLLLTMIEKQQTFYPAPGEQDA